MSLTIVKKIREIGKIWLEKCKWLKICWEMFRWGIICICERVHLRTETRFGAPPRQRLVSKWAQSFAANTRIRICIALRHNTRDTCVCTYIHALVYAHNARTRHAPVHTPTRMCWGFPSLFRMIINNVCILLVFSQLQIIFQCHVETCKC